MKRLRRVASCLMRAGSLIRFSHTVFALPFALVAFMAASAGDWQWNILGWVLLCMVAARTSAMLFNRLADWSFDQENPRTEERHLLLPKMALRVGWVASLLVFFAATTQLNLLCLALAPLAIFLITFYSLTKRFTWTCHFFLGLALAAAPMGAWAAVTGELYSLAPWLLAAGVFFWVAGFDLIYALLDEEVDRRLGLKSVPACFGAARSRKWAARLHIMAVPCFALFGWQMGYGSFYWLALVVVIACLIWEHRLAAARDTLRINTAFFQANACVGVALLLGVWLSI